MKITVTPKVRELLAKLDTEFEKSDAITRQLAEGRLEDTEAVLLGADREYVKGTILGLAFQIRMASTGRKLEV